MEMNLEEAIKYLKHYIEMWSPKDSEESRAIETVLQTLEKLQQDNYKLDRENQLLFESQIDSIPKKKIEEKIKIYKNMCARLGLGIDKETFNMFDNKIKVLQELLEEE